MTVIFRSAFNTHRSGALTTLFVCYVVGATCNCCRLHAHSVYTIQPCTSLQCHFIQSHICRVHVHLAVTFHLLFWQNNQDLLPATAATRGWNDTEIRVSTESVPWRRTFSHLACWDLNSQPFNHKSGALPLTYPHSPVQHRQ